MSVSLDEVLRRAGFDVKNDIEDARWLLSQNYDWEELYQKAEELDDLYCDYEDCKDTAEEDGDYGFPSFEEWRELQNGE